MLTRRLPALAVFSVLFILGCGGSGSGSGGGSGSTNPGNGLAAGGATSVFAFNLSSSSASGSVVQFSAGANGTVTPQSTLTLPSTFQPANLAADSTFLYVAGFDSAASAFEILVYTNGSTSLLRTITVPGAGCSGFVVVASSFYCNSAQSGVTQYPLTGALAPIRNISGSATGLNSTSNTAFAVDSSGNIFVSTPLTSTSARLAIFSGTATGNIAPSSTLTVAAEIASLAVDSSGHLYAAQTPVTGNTIGLGSIVEYSSSLTPIKTITPATTASAQIMNGVQVDSVGNLYLLNSRYNGSGYSRYLQAFAPSASGTVTANTEASSTAFTMPGSSIAIR